MMVRPDVNVSHVSNTTIKRIDTKRGSENQTDAFMKTPQQVEKRNSKGLDVSDNQMQEIIGSIQLMNQLHEQFASTPVS